MSEVQDQNSTKWWCHQWLRLNLLKPWSFLGIIPKASETKFHQVWITKLRVIHVQIPVPKWEKTKKWEKNFWITKRCNKGITNKESFRDFKMGQKDYKSGQGFEIGQRDFKSGQRLKIGGKKDFKSGQGLQIGAEQLYLSRKSCKSPFSKMATYSLNYSFAFLWYLQSSSLSLSNWFSQWSLVIRWKMLCELWL